MKLKRLFAFIMELAQKKFYGKLIINLESGNIVRIEKRETIKIN